MVGFYWCLKYYFPEKYKKDHCLSRTVYRVRRMVRITHKQYRDENDPEDKEPSPKRCYSEDLKEPNLSEDINLHIA